MNDLCAVCDEVLGYGYHCDACWEFRLAADRATVCTNCEIENAIARGLCRACYQYRYRTGRDRPITSELAVSLSARRNERKELARLDRLRGAHDAGF